MYIYIYIYIYLSSKSNHLLYLSTHAHNVITIDKLCHIVWPDLSFNYNNSWTVKGKAKIVFFVTA